MSKFEDNLWREVMHDHGDRLAGTPAPTGAGRRRGRRLVAGTTVALAGAGTALALVLSAASSPPAFAVSRNSDGTVHVWIRRVQAIAGLNARLAQLNVPVRAVAVTASCAPVPSAVTSRGGVVGPMHLVTSAPVAQAVVNARVDPRRIPRGQTLVIAAQAVGRTARLVGSGTVAHGKVPACMTPGAVQDVVTRFQGGTCKVASRPAPSPATSTGTGTTTSGPTTAPAPAPPVTTSTGTTTTTTTGGTSTTGAPPTSTGTSTTVTGTNTTSGPVATAAPPVRLPAACRAGPVARARAIAKQGSTKQGGPAAKQGSIVSTSTGTSTTGTSTAPAGH